MTAEPNEQDRANAAYRAGVAEKQSAEYREVEQLASEALGGGYRPWMKLVLLDSDYHRRASVPVAVVYKVFKGNEKLDENSVYLRRMEDGRVEMADSYESLFGEQLNEPHPTKTIEVKGQVVHPPRYSLCWSALELYSPKSAAELAESRVKREKKKIEKEADDSPLFKEQILSGEYRFERNPRGR